MRLQLLSIMALAALALAASAPVSASPAPANTTPLMVAQTQASDATLVAANNAQKAKVVVDFSTFYRETFNANLGSYINANPLEQQHGAESARVWTEDQMPESLRYSRDGGAWSADIERDGNRFEIPDQPCGSHKYWLRATFASGKGIYCMYTKFTPTLKNDETAKLEVSKKSLQSWQKSKKITFKLCDRLRECNPGFVTGTAKAIIDDQEYTVGTNGQFTANVEFMPAQTLQVDFKGKEGKFNCSMSAFLRDFEATPLSPNFVVITNDHIGD